MTLVDDAKPEFDPEREMSPEKKQWKPEWLRSDRERNEAQEKKETGKKDRAKELKSAAKKRGEELEQKREQERLRAEQTGVALAPEQDVAPKGEKLRKKWRRAILEKSRRLLEFFRRDEPESIDGVRLAEIMVAERIVALNEHLETTEPKTDERRETKTELDFMGLLSEKLSSPEIEVPEEIEEVHRVIVQESADMDALPADIAGESMGDAIGEQEQADGDGERTPPIESSADEDEADIRHDAFVRYGVVVIAALRKATASRQVHGSPGGGSLGVGMSGAAKQAATTPSTVTASAPARASYSPIMAAVPLVTTAAVVHQLTRERPTHQEHPGANSVIAKETPRANSVTPTPPVHVGGAERVVHHEVAQSQVPYRAVTSESIARSGAVFRSIERRDTHHENTEATYRPGVRLEQMETKELLELSRDVAIGNGQYLKRAYELGQIDRDGLIQVLKAKRRGQDYHLRYRLASRAHRERVRVANTPERLPQPREDAANGDAPFSNTRDSAEPSEHGAEQSVAREQSDATPASTVSSEKNVKEIIDEMRADAAREHQLPIGAILVGAGLVIATGTIYFMFFR